MLPAAACMRSHAASFYLLEMRKSRQRWAAGFLSRITMGLKRGGRVFRLVDFPLFSGKSELQKQSGVASRIGTCRKPVRGLRTAACGESTAKKHVFCCAIFTPKRPKAVRSAVPV